MSCFATHLDIYHVRNKKRMCPWRRGSPRGTCQLVKWLLALSKTTRILWHQSALAELMHDGCGYYGVYSCGQAEISWKSLFVQHIVKLLCPLIPLHNTTKHSNDIVASRWVLPVTDIVKLSSSFIPHVLPSPVCVCILPAWLALL